LLKKYDKPIAYILIIVGIIQLILILSVSLAFGGDSFSKFLFSAFDVGAVYMPGLFFVGAYLILKKPFNQSLFYYSISSVFIFFPVATLLKIIFSDKNDPVIKKKNHLLRMF